MGERLVPQREMPPFRSNRFETVSQHGFAQDHAVMKLLLGDMAVSQVSTGVRVASKRGVAFRSEPVEGAAHVHFFLCGHVEKGQVDSGAACMPAFFRDVTQLKEFVSGYFSS